VHLLSGLNNCQNVDIKFSAHVQKPKDWKAEISVDICFIQ